MLIALLVVLGVDLIVVVAIAALVFERRRWLKRQPDEFVGAIRVSDGQVDGLSPKWKRGDGPFEGQDPRELVDLALTWVSDYLDEVDRRTRAAEDPVAGEPD